MRDSSRQKVKKLFCSKVKTQGWISTRAVTVADFYHRSGNGPTTAGGAVL